MILIISDIHFGRGGHDAERAKERDLLNFLETVTPDLEALYLLGDVFDQFVEYRHLIPKGFERFKGRLAALTDAGVPVHYVVGNHDPWHIDYFEKELGATVALAAITQHHRGRTLVLGHGDEAADGPVAAWTRRAVRHPVSHALFRTLLPADVAYRLTRWTKERLAADPIDMRVVAALERHAARLLDGGADAVVLGHSHLPQCVRLGSGVYVNAGSWDVDRSYVTVDDDAIVVGRWNGEDVFVYPFVVANDDGSRP